MDKKIKKFINEEKLYYFLYGKIIIEDFVFLAKENLLNINIEDYVYMPLTFQNVISILDDEHIRNIDFKNSNFLNIASGSGKILLLAQYMYNFANGIGIDNIYEMYIISKNLLLKSQNSEEFDLSNNQERRTNFFLRDPFFIELREYKLIIVGYNNNNSEYMEMLQKKIELETKRDTIVVTIFKNFNESDRLKLINQKLLYTKNNRKFFVFYYKTT